MTAAAEWLSGRAASYHRDAGRLARLRGVPDDLTDSQWAAVYRAIAAELYKCADAVGGIWPDGEHRYTGLGGCTCGWMAAADLETGGFREAHDLHVTSQRSLGGRPDWVKSTHEKSERP